MRPAEKGRPASTRTHPPSRPVTANTFTNKTRNPKMPVATRSSGTSSYSGKDSFSMRMFAAHAPPLCRGALASREVSGCDIVHNPMSKSKSEQEASAADRDLYSGLIRLHVLHHAAEGPV